MSLDIEYIKSVVKDILDRNHNNKTKREIKLTPTSVDPEKLNFACPICGDSEKISSKKRGNLYLKSLRYKCFNCGESESFLSLAKRFDHELDLDKKVQMVDYINENIDKIRFSEDEFVIKNLDKLIPIEELTKYFNEDDESKITDFKPVQKGSRVYNYLNDRKIFNHDDIYEGVYWHTRKWSEPILINMNQTQNKVLGIQVRNIKNRDNRFYKIFAFSELYKSVYKKDLDDIEKIGYDKLSYLYNILKVNWNYPITVFEGFLDTKFFPNSVGCVGTNTDLSILLNQDIKIRFFYDYDKAGLKKQKELIRDGYSVFLWEKFFENWSSTSKNPSSAIIKLKHNIVDLNDIAKIVNNPYKALNMENYFSVDELDMLWIKDINI
jgi:predicted RNA-binding Zn-ribbon protein involved in translation (DUF1610 family)